MMMRTVSGGRERDRQMEREKEVGNEDIINHHLAVVALVVRLQLTQCCKKNPKVILELK